MSFSWILFYEELANKLLPYENNQKKLVDFLIKAGVKPSTLHDQKEKGKRIPLEEIDPFSFFSHINKHGKEKRLNILKEMASLLNISIPIPIDIDGIPVAYAQNTFYFSYQYEREPDDISVLWQLFRDTLNNTITNELFMRSSHIKQIGISKLTMGLFWIRPNQYLSLDSVNIASLNNNGIFLDKERLTSEKGFDYYQELLEQVKMKFATESFPEISYAAYINSQEVKTKDVSSGPDYWLYAPGSGAEFWHENQEKGIMSIGWDDLGDLRQYISRDEILSKMKELYGNNPKHDSLACWEFCNAIKPGDYIFAKEGRGKIIGYGMVESDYLYDATELQFRNIRKVKWLENGEWNMPNDSSLVTKTLTHIGPNHSLYKLFDQIRRGEGNAPLDLTAKESSGKSFYWLHANPSIWSLRSLPVGEVVTYTTFNEEGRKRQIYKDFLSAKPGDQVIGYSTTPDKKIVSLCRVVQGVHQVNGREYISFMKLADLANPVFFSELIDIPEFVNENGRPFFLQGSLFRISEQFYADVMKLIKEKNPDLNMDGLPGASPVIPYTLDEAMEGLFLDKDAVQGIVETLKRKKNIILQGPPGVGKSFIAKRIGYLLMAEKVPSRMEVAQFHQSYGYEDFIQGYRPDGKGSFKLDEGIFYKFCRKAQEDIQHPYVFIIDEINRGNLSRIFGEVLTLIEDDKRSMDWAVSLSYNGEKFFVPPNLYIIGLMNTADRSLALVDFALRRRFSFTKLTPEFTHPQFKLHLQSHGVEESLIDWIIKTMTEINQDIGRDTPNLGEGYQIGHSYFCPKNGQNDKKWCLSVIEGEIIPLLDEYYFDDSVKASSYRERLLNIS